MTSNSDQEMVDIVVLDGTVPIEEKYPLKSLTKANSWEECPIPNMLGIPVMAKPIRPYPGGLFPSSQHAVFMLVEPVTGLAPARWQLGPRCNVGLIGFGREDGKPFTAHQWGDLHLFIYDLMDSYSAGEEMSKETITKTINPNAFIRHTRLNNPGYEPYEPVYLCARCSQPATNRCNKCHYTYYCSRNCQVKIFKHVLSIKFT